MCLYLVMDRVDRPMPVARGCCTIITWLVVVFNALVLCLGGMETLMYFSFIPVESRARSIVFPPEPATA